MKGGPSILEAKVNRRRALLRSRLQSPRFPLVKEFVALAPIIPPCTTSTQEIGDAFVVGSPDREQVDDGDEEDFLDNVSKDGEELPLESPDT